MNEPNTAAFPDAIKPVLAVLEQSQAEYTVKTYASPAKSAGQAAELIGCPLGAIVKSLFFALQETDDYLLVLTSGANRVSGERLEAYLQQRAKPASPAVVLEKTGFPVGGVPPFGHKTAFPVVMDIDLMQYDRVWASAGAIHAVMGMTPQDILDLSHAELYDVKEV